MLTTVIATSVLVALAGLLTLPAVRDLTRSEARWVQLALLAHVLATFAQLLLVMWVFGGLADYVNFHRHGAMIASAMRVDFIGVAPRTLAMLLQQDVMLNMPLPMEAKGGGTTAAMWSIAAWGNLLLGPSLLSTSVAVALFSFGGKLALYRTLRPYLEPALRIRVLAGVLLLPSAVYWTAGLIKEGVAMGGLGFVMLGLSHLHQRRLARGLTWVVVGLPFLAVKSYLFLPLAVACATFLYVDRASLGGRRAFRIRPLALVAAVTLGTVGVLAVGEVFPKFAISSLGDQAAQMQYYGTRSGGRTSYNLIGADRSLLGQVQVAPMALLTAVYRPTLLEVRSPPMLLSAIETTGIAIITLMVIRRQGVRRLVPTILRSPVLAFCVAFWIPTALGVGLVSNTLGTLSRYRVPMMPFLITSALIVQAAPVRRRQRKRSPSPAQATPLVEPVEPSRAL